MCTHTCGAQPHLLGNSRGRPDTRLACVRALDAAATATGAQGPRGPERDFPPYSTCLDASELIIRTSQHQYRGGEAPAGGLRADVAHAMALPQQCSSAAST